jgi:hypothetical protein
MRTVTRSNPQDGRSTSMLVISIVNKKHNVNFFRRKANSQKSKLQQRVKSPKSTKMVSYNKSRRSGKTYLAKLEEAVFANPTSPVSSPFSPFIAPAAPMNSNEYLMEYHESDPAWPETFDGINTTASMTETLMQTELNQDGSFMNIDDVSALVALRAEHLS